MNFLESGLAQLIELIECGVTINALPGQMEGTSDFKQIEYAAFSRIRSESLKNILSRERPES